MSAMPDSAQAPAPVSPPPEIGATARPPWHHDISYFDFEGSMCVLWPPLDETSKADGIAFVRGSHLWNRLSLRTYFADYRDLAAGLARQRRRGAAQRQCRGLPVAADGGLAVVERGVVEAGHSTILVGAGPDAA